MVAVVPYLVHPVAVMGVSCLTLMVRGNLDTHMRKDVYNISAGGWKGIGGEMGENSDTEQKTATR